MTPWRQVYLIREWFSITLTPTTYMHWSLATFTPQTPFTIGCKLLNQCFLLVICCQTLISIN
jgi:hypothetical protein